MSARQTIARGPALASFDFARGELLPDMKGAREIEHRPGAGAVVSVPAGRHRVFLAGAQRADQAIRMCATVLDPDVGLGLEVRMTQVGTARTGYTVKVYPARRALRIDRALITPERIHARAIHAADDVPQIGGPNERIELEVRCAGAQLSVHVGETCIATVWDERYGYGAASILVLGTNVGGRALVESVSVHQVTSEDVTGQVTPSYRARYVERLLEEIAKTERVTLVRRASEIEPSDSLQPHAAAFLELSDGSYLGTTAGLAERPMPLPVKEGFQYFELCARTRAPGESVLWFLSNMGRYMLATMSPFHYGNPRASPTSQPFPFRAYESLAFGNGTRMLLVPRYQFAVPKGPPVEVVEPQPITAEDWSRLEPLDDAGRAAWIRALGESARDRWSRHLVPVPR